MFACTGFLLFKQLGDKLVEFLFADPFFSGSAYGQELANWPSVLRSLTPLQY